MDEQSVINPCIGDCLPVKGKILIPIALCMNLEDMLSEKGSYKRPYVI